MIKLFLYFSMFTFMTAYGFVNGYFYTKLHKPQFTHRTALTNIFVWCFFGSVMFFINYDKNLAILMNGSKNSEENGP
jgi:1,4-dihydroxy-2-naphthoate octaprenyltransferase